ncbi:unnamed protein product [Closterium sp. Yama58-4]|nr:unnamed protein product [Closterium sp. Yama58-4]
MSYTVEAPPFSPSLHYAIAASWCCTPRLKGRGGGRCCLRANAAPLSAETARLSLVSSQAPERRGSDVAVRLMQGNPDAD